MPNDGAHDRSRCAAVIRGRIDEFYRPENVIDKLLEGMDAAEVTQVEDQAADDLSISAEQASRAPVVRLVDLILSEGIISRASDVVPLLKA